MLAPSDPPSLHTLNGTLEHCGERVCVDGSVDFGPVWYVAYDYDGDQVIGSLAEEVAGLIGQKVTFETDGGSLDQDVFTVNGLRCATPTVSCRPRTAHRATPRPGEWVLDLV